MADEIPTTMGAVVIEGPRRARVRQVPTPRWGDDEVLIEVQGCGVCGSNLPVWEGRPWFNYPLPPGNPGHEGWGVVVRAGSKVSAVRPGDRVGFLSDRAFAQYATASEAALALVPGALGEKPFPAEALGCIANIFRRAQVRAGQKVAIVGIGFLGAGLVALASRAGAQVVAISRRPWALELAFRLGAQQVVELGGDVQTIAREVVAFSGGDGCQQVIEAVGQQHALTVASELVATGGRLIIAGYHRDGARQVDLQRWNWRGIDVINAHERAVCTSVEGMRVATDAVSSGALKLEQLVTHRFDFSEAGEAFTALEERPEGFLKAVLTP